MKFHFHHPQSKQPQNSPPTYEESLRLDLAKTKWELENAYAGFDYVTDPDLIDCYIYELNSIMKRYKYLLGKLSSLKKTQLEDSLTAAEEELEELPPGSPSPSVEIIPAG